MSRQLLILAVCLANCSGPATNGPNPGPRSGASDETFKPSWVDGKSARYPDATYLSAVGRGPNRKACEDDGHGALSRIFNAKIHAESRTWQRYFSRVNSARGNLTVEAVSVSQLSRVTTDKVLKGVRIAQLWRGGDGTYHCLATLERFATARELRLEIQRLDAQLRLQLRQGDDATDPAARFRAYGKAMTLMQRREALNVDLRIVDPRGGAMPPPQNWEALVAKFQGAKAKIKVGLKLTGTRASKIQTCLAEQLTREGMELLEYSSDVDLIIHGKLKYQKAGNISGSVMVQADIDLRINNVANGKTIAAFSDDIKVGRPTLQRAVQLAVYRLCHQVVPRLADKIRTSFKK